MLVAPSEEEPNWQLSYKQPDPILTPQLMARKRKIRKTNVERGSAYQTYGSELPGAGNRTNGVVSDAFPGELMTTERLGSPTLQVKIIMGQEGIPALSASQWRRPWREQSTILHCPNAPAESLD